MTDPVTHTTQRIPLHAQTRRYFAALYPDAPPGTWGTFWTRAGPCRGVPAGDHAALVWTAQDLGAADDVYVGIGLRGRDHGPRARGGTADVVAIPGVWAECDVADGVKPGRAFADRHALDGFVQALPLAPTMIVASAGDVGGLHLYWLFRELWVLDDPGEHAAAQDLLRRWQAWLRQRALAVGAGLDATADLARVLRPAGTMNRKREPARPVQLLTADGPRVNPGDLDDLVAGVELPRTAPGAAVALDSVPADAEPPAAKFALLYAASPRFRRTWLRHRPDLIDQSPSAYDLAVAAIAVDAGWTDAEVAALLVARRRHAGDPPKARADYLARTIARARQRRHGVVVGAHGLRIATAPAPPLAIAPAPAAPLAVREVHR